MAHAVKFIGKLFTKCTKPSVQCEAQQTVVQFAPKPVGVEFSYKVCKIPWLAIMIPPTHNVIRNSVQNHKLNLIFFQENFVMFSHVSV